MTYENFKTDLDSDGILTVTWDMPDRSMNVLSGASMKDLGAIIDYVTKTDDVKGVVLTSAKAAFGAGADLSEMGSSAGSSTGELTREQKLKKQYDSHMGFIHLLRTMETSGKPWAAAINGLAMGGCLEITLACHYRVAVDDDSIQLALPEAKVGLLPGGGGTQRLPRLIGAAEALPLLLQGKSVRPKKAAEMGIIHKAVPAKQLIAEAKRWIKEEGDAEQPWDKKGFKVPGGSPYDKGNGTTFVIGNALLRKTTYGNYPAQTNIMKCVYEGIQVPIDAGLRIEARYFIDLLNRPESKNMIRSLFLSSQELSKGARRPAGIERKKVQKLGMLGAGMMGAGIAYVSAKVGMDVVLIDANQEGADKGKAYSENLLDKAIAKGRETEEGKKALLSRITATTDYDQLKGCDLVIEAVFEDRDVKAEVTKKAEAVIAKDAIYGSNTSTLPITGLAKASERPGNFIGIHFFSPVDRMPLVEIILGKETSDEALALAIDYVAQIKKTPIVVNDSRGFYTSRCFGTYVSEGVEMLASGIAPAIVDNVGRMTGMPRGPLELSDDVALDLAHRVRTATKKDLGDKYIATAADPLMEKMVVEQGRLGRKNGKGFYDYPEDGKKRLWPGLSDLVDIKVTLTTPEMVEDLKKRLLYRQAVEAAKCFEEGVVTDVRDADVGSIMGWGFAPYTGGPLSLIDTVGAKAFVEACDKYADDLGERFRPCDLLRDMAETNDTFYNRFNPKGQVAAAAE